ncbi:MAG: hypothetical protein NTX79_05350 [Candidatus Micrarchaeota archaeon]|nr:hypothetical protein [Candidatus Micrarchaeota archaeon]
MMTHAAKAVVLLLLLALPALSFAQNPYSDAAFRTFISVVSVDGTKVTVNMTFLNVTYFRQINETMIAEVAQKVNATRNINDMYQQGSYSTDSFTAEILPVNNSSLRFTFEGQNVTDASGAEICNPVHTDENGIASCEMKYYKDIVNGEKRSLEDYGSCGYATITSDELTRGSLTLPSASQTTTVCPDNAVALSAFAPAIQSEVGSNLPFCFPAMLIAGLLVAAMYYAGRDPLSLFDITAPKLPKTPTFKVKMQTSPQMLRQVQRRYAMIKHQARRDSVREIARLAKKSGMGVAEAKRAMNEFYDKMETLMKNKLSEDQVLSNKRMLAELLERYSPKSLGIADEAYEKRFRRSIEISSGMHEAYLKSHQAWMAMNEARGKTGKGNLWTRNVSKPLLDRLMKASVGFEKSKVGMVLGRIPFVKRVVAAPTKMLDVSSQLRGSRQSLKAIRGEMLGQVATMLGQTRVGRPIYNAFRSAHVKGDGKAQTKFGKAYTFMTGRDWRTFEDKHNLAKRSLVDYHDVIASKRQWAIDAYLNRMFDEIASKLIDALPIRANRMLEIAKIMGIKGANDAETAALLAKIGNATAVDMLFKKIQESLGASGKKGEEVAKKIESLLTLPAGKAFERQMDIVERAMAGLGPGEKAKVAELLANLRNAAAVENELNALLKARYDSQGDLLNKLAALVGESRGKDISHVMEAMGKFKSEEKTLRENLFVYLDSKNYYQILDKEQLRSEIADGMTDKKLEEKYGKGIFALFESPELLRQMLGVRTATTGQKLKDAIDALLGMMKGGLSADEARELAQIAADYGGKGKLTDKQVAKIAARMEALDNLREVVNRKVFGKFDERERNMETWLLGEKSKILFDSYNNLADRLNKRLGERLSINELAREGWAFGKNPLELVIEKALREAIIAKATAGGMGEAAAQDLANRIIKIINDTQGGKHDTQGGKPLRDIDSLEQFFSKKASGEARTSAEFAGLLGRLNVNSETLLKAAMVNIDAFAREWSARNYAAIEILHGGEKAGSYMANYANALRDIVNSSKVKSHLAYLGGEKEFYRQEMGMADYKTIGLESAIFTARGWEKLFGFIVSKDWGGSSRGEQVLHLMGAAREEHASTLERYNVLYRNLMDRTSVFYDGNFKAGNGQQLDADSYKALLKRGYTWQDKKNGLELLMSVDRKSTPMLEYRGKEYFGAKAWDKDGKVTEWNTAIVLRPESNGGKGDIRNYAKLLASTMGSYYSTREVGFVVLMKRGDKWVYGDPFLDKQVKGATDTADKKVTMRKDIMEKMVGGDDTVRVVSTKDFVTYAKDKRYSGENGFFGNLNRADRFREGVRSVLYKPAMLYGEFIYGAYSGRLDKMSQWYAAQYQVRQTLDRLSATIKSGEDNWVDGDKRFKYDQERLDRIYDPDNRKYAHLPSVSASEDVRNSLKEEMKGLAKGDGTFADSAKAWWYNFRGRIASNIVGEIGVAESNFYNARLEGRALEKLHQKGEINDNDYNKLSKEISARNERIGKEYDSAKKEYMGLNRDMLGWTGSTHMFTYETQRTIWNLGLAGRLFDSKYVQGTQDAFYQITESSVMRDPRVAIGASAPGWEHSYYVGYHTGQNVYERARFWATNSLWEQQMRFHTDLVYTVHKWWNDRMSFFSRYTSGYPAPVKSDMMYAPSYEGRTTKDYFKALLWIMPFQSRTYSDYFRSRWQAAINFSGAGTMLASYQSLGNVERYDTPGEDQERRSWLRRQLDKFGMESEHYYNAGFRIASQQRYIDQIMRFEDYVDRRGKDVVVDVGGESMSLVEARDLMNSAKARMDSDEEERYKQGISDAIGKVANLKDRRGAYVRQVFSGSDIQEDGSRNRFLDMYIMFHSNVFVPTIPGMYQASPIGRGEVHTFPQVAREVEKAGDGTRLGAMKHYWQAGYDSDSGRITFSDQFTTKQDAVAEAYRNDVPVLMHLMKMQSKEIGYSMINSPQLSYINPVWFGLGRMMYKTALSHTPGLEDYGSTFREPDWTHFALSAIPGANSVRDYMRRRRGELPPRETLDGDNRHLIYGMLSKSIVHEGEKSNSFFRDLIYGAKFGAAAGVQKVKKRAMKEYIPGVSGGKMG